LQISVKVPVGHEEPVTESEVLCMREPVFVKYSDGAGLDSIELIGGSVDIALRRGMLTVPGHLATP